MTTELITPDSDAHWHAMRAEDITSTDVAALFGLSPYCTKYELWHRKKSGNTIQIEDNDRMRWGRRLEAAIAEGIAEDHGWRVKPLKLYARDRAHRMGASFDFEILGDPRGPGVLEVKNVDGLQYKRGWSEDEAPAHIEIQLQAQLATLEPLGFTWGVIAALVGGNSPAIIIREYDRTVAHAMRAAAANFWRSIDENDPPPPVFPEDSSIVIRMNQHAEPGTLIDLGTSTKAAELAALYDDASNREKRAKDDKDSAKAELLEMIGTHEKAILPNAWKLNASVVAPSAGTLITPEMVGTHIGARNGYRNFRITAPKSKE